MFTPTTRSLQRRQPDFPLSVLTQAEQKQLIDTLGSQPGKNGGRQVGTALLTQRLTPTRIHAEFSWVVLSGG
jgi:hypothetical protein